MTAELISAAAPSQPEYARSLYRPVVGVLADGTPFYAPIGEVLVADARVTCHLCGRSFRSVTAHLRAHGWSKERYCTAFGLERTQSLEGHETRKLRSAAFAARLIFEPAVREGSAAGRARARAGELARDAAAAARGRPFPEQRQEEERASQGCTPVGRGQGSQPRARRPRPRGRRRECSRQVRLRRHRLARGGQDRGRDEPGCRQPRDRPAQGLAVQAPAQARPVAASQVRQRPGRQPDAAWAAGPGRPRLRRRRRLPA